VATKACACYDLFYGRSYVVHQLLGEVSGDYIHCIVS